MEIKIIDFGAEHMPARMHPNDAGADVYAPKTYRVAACSVQKIPLGFGLELPDGVAGYVFPRSSLSAHGIVCELPPIDSGYRGEIHAIVTNNTDTPYLIKKGDRIGQLVLMPVLTPSFVLEKSPERGAGAFGSTGK